MEVRQWIDPLDEEMDTQIKSCKAGLSFRIRRKPEILDVEPPVCR